MLLACIAVAAFANAWPDMLTYDDRVFVDHVRFSGIGLGDIGRFFVEDLWAASGVESGLYRPLLLIFISVQAWLFDDWLAGYHGVSILLHALATLLVHGLVSHVLENSGVRRAVATPSAWLAAVVFAVHPVHAEAVNSVFNTSEILVCIGLTGGLAWFLRRLDQRPLTAWTGLSLIYLLVLLCRESGAALPALAVALIWLTRTDPWPSRLRTCLPVFVLLIPLGLYLGLRGHALAPPPPAPKAVSAEIQNAVPANETGKTTPDRTDSERSRPGLPLRPSGIAFQPDRMASAVRLWFASIEHLLWPHPLLVEYEPPDAPLWIAILTQLALVGAAFWLFLQRSRPALLAGLTFFYLALLPSSRIFGQADFAPGLADRILYTPSVGMTLALAAGIAWILRNRTPRVAVSAIAVLSLVLVSLTWARNTEWTSDTILLESDYAKSANKRRLLNSLISAQLRAGNDARAREICDVHAQALLEKASWGVQCGMAYGRSGRFADAEKAFRAATRHRDSRAFAHANLAMLLAHLGRQDEAGTEFDRAVATEKVPFLREYFAALKLIRLYASDRTRLEEARAHLLRSLELQPQHVAAREELEQLDARLGLRGREGR
ncbi:tetratricopeptide repeat protein [Elongatibacter sediminis]|uniref:Tetratricopeptide repeat protein n=1 Tax=Elongatibacter sediminis TaxID=3119006 RepID=A0AAW9R636_9GAMM